jgi:FkbM family methyltransferase
MSKTCVPSSVGRSLADVRAVSLLVLDVMSAGRNGLAGEGLPMSNRVSYAQNFEDVILHRALARVQKGNYIDIGAQGALVDSVSQMFHDLGWAGIHVEPVTSYADELAAARPGDKVVRAAVGDKRGTIRLHEVIGTGLSTTDEAIAAEHRRQGFDVVERVVPLVTLDDVFSEAGFDHVHWLKIDVEGLEASVIRGWNSHVRPWVLIVESTLPLSQVETHESWEPMLLAKNYAFAYFDGLNRYYVSSEHRDLLPSFGPGPNVFDDFSLSGLSSHPFTDLLNAAVSARQADIDRAAAEHESYRRAAGADAAKAKRALDLLSDETIQLGRELRQHRESANYWWTAAEQLREELAAIKRSRSWRLTAPIRQLRSGDISFGALIRRIARGLLARVMARVVRRPALARRMRTILSLTPGLKARLRNIGVAYGFVPAGVSHMTGLDGHATAAHPALSLKASRVLKDIDLAMKAKEG